MRLGLELKVATEDGPRAGGHDGLAVGDDQKTNKFMEEKWTTRNGIVLELVDTPYATAAYWRIKFIHAL